ncbi:MAG: SDR family oxidoreductase [Alphaproteobacteria bacterium]|nr:SDR family oxidoreductase [Alphaproteobacteria bacterium]
MNSQPLALVTGGAQGIGYACAEALMADGARIILADINEDGVMAAAEKLGNGTVGMACDMGKVDQVNAMFDAIDAEHGPISILVNNAGVAMPGDMLDTDIADFQRVIDINLTGVFLSIQRAAKSMIAAGIEGAIVNMSSINAVVSIPSIPAYCASKGGVNQLTKSTSLALAPHNIRVNAVGPGSIDTDMLAGVNANPDAMKMVMSRTPLKRIGTTKEIADVVAFLASSKASYVTGETIYVDGGRLGMNYTC